MSQIEINFSLIRSVESIRIDFAEGIDSNRLFSAV